MDEFKSIETGWKRDDGVGLRSWFNFGGKISTLTRWCTDKKHERATRWRNERHSSTWASAISSDGYGWIQMDWDGVQIDKSGFNTVPQQLLSIDVCPSTWFWSISTSEWRKDVAALCGNCWMESWKSSLLVESSKLEFWISCNANSFFCCCCWIVLLKISPSSCFLLERLLCGKSSILNTGWSR